jgi:hypothetical protein
MSEARRWIFEPHNGYGSNDPDGEPWPFGYLTLTDPIDPIFELGDVGLRRAPGELAAHAGRIIRAMNERDELIAALREAEESLDAMVRELDLRPDGPNSRALAQVRAALAKADPAA